MKTATTLERKLSQRELAEHWGWSMHRLTRLVSQNEIPHLRIGKQVFFELSALEPWLEARRRATELLRGKAAPRSRAEERADLGLSGDPLFG